MIWSDVAEVEEESEPEFTHHAEIAASSFFQCFPMFFEI